jgi:hypothetical protein
VVVDFIGAQASYSTAVVIAVGEPTIVVTTDGTAVRSNQIG